MALLLEEARDLGFLGPGPISAHLDHAAGFAAAIEDEEAADPAWVPARVADLGSGGGVPGLALALRFQHSVWVLVESGVRRAGFLRGAVARLGIDDRVTVVEERAEVVGRSPGFRRAFELVVARSFGPPAVFAECAAPLLRVGGRAVVSEPPGGAPERWPADGLQAVGLAPRSAVIAAAASFQVLHQEAACPDRFPRRVGIPAKRPLF